MKNNRDDFPARIRHQIEMKSAYRCSNPACLKVVIGPSQDFRRVVHMGVVSHISAASPRGPRYDPSISQEERMGEENGVLLCRYCAALVDVDEDSYPPELLRQWRRGAYQRALEQLGQPTAGAQDSRSRLAVTELVRTCLCAYKTEGTVRKEANFRSCAAVLYRFLFETMPREPEYEQQLRRWNEAMHEITFELLVPVKVRISCQDHSFPRIYRTFIEELNSYDFCPREDRARLLDLIEAVMRQLCQSGEAFGLRDQGRLKDI